jgi:TM2 domain-containing membrane protein YozV
MFYLPGFMALLLIKSGEPSSFGITVELLMLSSGAAIIGGLFIGAQSSGAGADPSSKVGTWSGSLVLELLAVVPFLCAVPPLFHELAHSRLLHTLAPGAVDVSLGASEILPAVAIVPFMVYELAGFGTLHFIVSKPMNWIINMGVLCLIIGGYISNLKDAFDFERKFDGALVAAMTITVFYGVLKLKRLQTAYDADRPPKAPKE